MRSNFILLLLVAFISTIIIYRNIPIEISESKRKLKTSGAMEAMQFWNDSRSYPFTKLPDKGLVEEYKKFRANNNISKVNSSERWEEIGPHNIGGRTISLAFNPQNPNTIYAGSASGGLWRSFTGGEGVKAWDYVPTGFPVLGVSSIAIAEDDSNEIYIGTGEVYNYEETRGGVAIRETRGSYGIGILKTNDGGITWNKSLDWSYEQGTCVWVIKINPFNKNTVWAGTSEGTFKSLDAGKTWQKVNSVVMVNDLLIHPTDTNRVYISCGNLASDGHGIYRTDDNGLTWQQLTTGLPSTFGGKALFSMYKADPNIIYLSIGNGYWSGAGTWLCKTTDGGDTWVVQSQADYATYQGWFAHFAVVNADDPSKLLTAGVDVFKSSNSGVTQNQKSLWYAWDFGRPPAGGPEGPSNYSHADHHVYAVHPNDPNTIYFGNDGGVFRTTDFGETFEGLNGGYQTTQFYNGFVTSITDSNFSIGGMQDNSTAIYDGSKEWVRVIGGDGGWAAINQSDNKISYGSWQYGNIRKLIRTSFGNYSEQGLSLPGGNAAFIAPYVISVSNPNVMYLGKSIVHKSTNSGTSWRATNSGHQLSNNFPISMSLSSTDENFVIVGMAANNSPAEIFRTTDGGSNWKNIMGDLPDRYVTDVEIDPTDDNNVFVTLSGFGSSHAFRSTDKGETWINIGEGLPDVPTTAIISDPFYNNHLYVGNDLGVFFSSDYGETWIELNGGLPDACMVTNLSVSNSNKKLRIATHGNGVYERKLVSSVTNVEGSSSEIPINFTLKQNYPNPFNPSTTIEYTLSENVSSMKLDAGTALNPSGTNVKLVVYDLLGRKVNVLVNEYQPSGTYNVTWDGSNYSSGVYFYELSFGSSKLNKKMLLIK